MSCPLNGEGIFACLRSLGHAPAADDVIVLAARVRAQQIELAYQDFAKYDLWRDGYGKIAGLVKVSIPSRPIRKMYVHSHRDAWNEPTHWQVEGSEFQRAINAIHRALSDVSYRYPQRREQVRAVRPQPKHYLILRWLREQRREQKGLN